MSETSEYPVKESAHTVDDWFKEFSALPNPQVRVVGYPEWSHLDPLIHPKELVENFDF